MSDDNLIPRFGVRLSLECGHQTVISGDQTVCEVAWCGQCEQNRRITMPPPETSPNSMGDLVAFLNARLDEDEALARAASELDAGERWLREAVAKRAILDLHRIEVAKVELTPFDPYTGEARPDEYEVTCEICGWASDDPASACGTLRQLAAIYSDRPDYRAEWKP